MIILNVEQRSGEWYQARLGIPTASEFKRIITTKGEPSKSQEEYINELAYEAITGITIEGYMNQTMLRGIELEPEARDMYSFMNDVEVEEVGLCYRDEKKLYSCSPDGLIGDDGGLEMKCPLGKTHVKYLLAGELPTEYFQQVQGNLFITDRKWWDFYSYCEGIKPFILRVERNEKFIDKLDKELDKFTTRLAETIEKLRKL